MALSNYWVMCIMVAGCKLHRTYHNDTFMYPCSLHMSVHIILCGFVSVLMYLYVSVCNLHMCSACVCCVWMCGCVCVCVCACVRACMDVCMSTTGPPHSHHLCKILLLYMVPLD